MTTAKWTRRARADLARIDDYHRAIDMDVARRFGLAALAAARFLAEHPNAGPRTELGLRNWRVGGSPYLLFYQTRQEVVEIVCVCHAQQDWRPA